MSGKNVLAMHDMGPSQGRLPQAIRQGRGSAGLGVKLNCPEVHPSGDLDQGRSSSLMWPASWASVNSTGLVFMARNRGVWSA